MSMGSCIWADKRELIADHIKNCSQIVGHTPVKTIEMYDFQTSRYKKEKLIFTDTFSTYRDGTIYGDCSYLIFNPNAQNKDRIFEIKYLM